ncbi:hypothetical protein ACWENO_14055 [Streptomyces sp. NPDC004436]
MTAVQPHLDGTIPPPATDYETWLDQIRPAFADAARSGREFACWHIKVDKKLPDPPKPKTQWGSAMHHFAAEGLLEPASFTTTRDGSAVRTWRGTRAARQGRAA